MLHTSVLRGRMAAGLIVAAAALSGSAAVAQANGPYEPNDVENTATGPLGFDPAHSVVDAFMETDNDVDYFYFWAPPGHNQVRVDLANLSPDDGNYSDVSVELYGAASGTGSDSTFAYPGSTATLAYTVTGPDKVFVKVSCGVGCGADGFVEHYRLTMSPTNWPAADPTPLPPPVSAAPPPPQPTKVSSACRRSQNRQVRARRAYRHAQRVFKRRPTARHRRAVKRLRRKYQAARRAAARTC